MSNTLIISFKQPQPNNLGTSLAFASPPTTYPKCGQAKNRWRVQITTKKVVASLATCTRSGGEPAAGSSCCWGRQTERKTLPMRHREKCWQLSPPWLSACKRFFSFTRCSRKEHINRETGDCTATARRRWKQVQYVWQPDGASWGMSPGEFVCRSL